MRNGFKILCVFVVKKKNHIIVCSNLTLFLVNTEYQITKRNGSLGHYHMHGHHHHFYAPCEHVTKENYNKKFHYHGLEIPF